MAAASIIRRTRTDRGLPETIDAESVLGPIAALIRTQQTKAALPT
jgi:hypothetical protein